MKRILLPPKVQNIQWKNVHNKDKCCLFPKKCSSIPGNVSAYAGAILSTLKVVTL